MVTKTGHTTKSSNKNDLGGCWHYVTSLIQLLSLTINVKSNLPIHR